MNNRQAGRRRGRGGQRQGGNPGRPDNGNRIDNRARGNAAQLLEKYKNLATDAQRSGDRVATEYYLQFADHYFRVLAESRSRMDENGQRRSRDDEDDAEGVEDFGFEGDLGSPAHYNSPPVIQDRDDRDADRDGRPRRDRDDQRDGQRDGQRDDRPRQRDDQQREARPRRDREIAGNDASSDGERPRRDRDEQPRDQQPREARPRRDRETAGNDRPQQNREASNDVGEERPRREPRTYGREQAAEPRAEPVGEHPVAANDEPRRRGRPRRETAAVVESEGFDAALLPPAISAETAPAEEAAAPERPRRGRPRRVRDDEVVPPAA